MMQTLLIALTAVAFGIAGVRLWQDHAARSSTALAGAGAADKPASARSLGLTSKAMLGLACAIAAVALAGFYLMGRNAIAPDEPAPMSLAETGRDLADVDTMIASLSERLARNPDDGEGHRMLGWSYLMTDRPQAALAPYRRAIELLPDDATVHSGYGEALVAVAGGTVTGAAKAAFDRALALDGGEPRARYFTGRHLAQNGQARAALDRWIALANDGPADAAWRPDLIKDIEATAADLGVDVSAQLVSPTAPPAGVAFPAIDPAVMTAGESLPPDQQQKMIEGMVEGLATRLAADPSDAAGWARLIRSRMVMGDSEQAARDLATARRALAENRTGLAQVEATAREFGL